MDASCYAQNWIYAYDYQSRVASFVIRGDNMQDAVLNRPLRWEIQSDNPAMAVAQTDPATVAVDGKAGPGARGCASPRVDSG